MEAVVRVGKRHVPVWRVLSFCFGVSDTAARVFLEAVLPNGDVGVTVEEVASTLGVSYTSAWRLLRELVEAGLARRERGEPPSPEEGGRPPTVYKPTVTPEELLKLVEDCLEERGRQLAKALMEARASG